MSENYSSRICKLKEKQNNNTFSSSMKRLTVVTAEWILHMIDRLWLQLSVCIGANLGPSIARTACTSLTLSWGRRSRTCVAMAMGPSTFAAFVTC